MTSPITMYTDFDPRNLRFGALEKNKKGGKFVNVSLPSSKRAIIQTPEVSVPFGVTANQEAATGEIQSYSIEVSMRNPHDNRGIQPFLDRMLALDDVLLEAAVANSKEWFGKSMSKDVVAELLRKLVRQPANPQYPPQVKIKVPLSNGKVTSRFFDENCNEVSMDYVTKGCTVKMILELGSVWFVNKNFGVTWRLVQAAVTSRKDQFDAYAFATDDAPPAAS